MEGLQSFIASCAGSSAGADSRMFTGFVLEKLTEIAPTDDEVNELLEW